MLISLSVALLGAGVGGCGGIGQDTTHAPLRAPFPHGVTKRAGGSASPPRRDADGDRDNPGRTRYDGDDYAILDFGRAAGAGERGSIGALIERYYTAAAAADGEEGCRLIYGPMAESIAEEYESRPGSPEPHDRCAAVLSRLFMRRHKQMAAKAAKLSIGRVRIAGERGVALLSFGKGVEHHLLLHRERGAWKIFLLFDSELP